MKLLPRYWARFSTDSLRDLSRLTIAELLDRRYEKFRRMGQFFEAARI